MSDAEKKVIFSQHYFRVLFFTEWRFMAAEWKGREGVSDTNLPFICRVSPFRRQAFRQK